MWLERYREEIAAGNILVGAELRTWLDKLVADMEDPRFFYDTSEADERIDFMERCIRLTKSPFYGKPMVLMLWQKAYIESLYSFRMAGAGSRRFRRSLLLIARKNTKSEMSSALELTELVVGTEGSDIICASNDDKQCGILYEAIDVMRQKIDPKSRDTHRNQQWILCKANGSHIFKLSERTQNKEGRNIDFAVVDEAHEMEDNSIIMAIEQSQSTKDNPMLVVITTEGMTLGGFLDDELRICRAIINGEYEGDDADRHNPWLYTQDSEAEVWQDRDAWVKSNPALGVVKKWDYLDIQIAKARRSKPDRIYVLSKDFNIKQSASQSWLFEEDYAYDSKFEIEDFRGSLCLGAVDLSETTDMSCAKILLMRAGDAVKYIHTMYFIPEAKLQKSDDSEVHAKYVEWAEHGWMTILPGNDLDLAKVADWFFGLYEDFGIRPYKIGYDQRFAKDFLRRIDEYGIESEMVWQNAVTLSNATKLVEADLKDRKINYNENPVDRWCFGNAAIKVDNYGNVIISKPKEKNRRIDGAATLVDLIEIYRRYKSEFLSGLA
jgi:phage terminase large subunit-like protein